MQRFIKPLDEKLIMEIATNLGEVVISIEEGSIGGFGSHVMQLLSDRVFDKGLKFRSMILPDIFANEMVHKMYETAGLNSQSMTNK